jgi:hypothetical protein
MNKNSPPEDRGLEIIPVKKLFAKKIVWKVGDILNLANFIPSNFRKPIIFGYNKYLLPLLPESKPLIV